MNSDNLSVTLTVKNNTGQRSFTIDYDEYEDVWRVVDDPDPDHYEMDLFDATRYVIDELVSTGFWAGGKPE